MARPGFFPGQDVRVRVDDGPDYVATLLDFTPTGGVAIVKYGVQFDCVEAHRLSAVTMIVPNGVLEAARPRLLEAPYYTLRRSLGPGRADEFCLVLTTTLAVPLAVARRIEATTRCFPVDCWMLSQAWERLGGYPLQ